MDPSVAHLAARHPALRLLVLLGSRATGTHHSGSDWDLGVIGGDVDLLALRDDLTQVLGTDDVDVVDLARASAVLRRDAAVDGRPLIERDPDAFADFQLDAVRFWCDVEPVLREAHADVLRAAAG